MKRLFIAVVFAILLAARAGSSSAGDWPQWRHDAARSARSPDGLPDDLSLRWVLQLPSPRPAWPVSQPTLRFDVSYSPVAADKTLFVPSMVTDTVSAYDTDTGRRKWRFHSEGPVRFAPLFDGGKVYFGSDDGHLYCLDAESGTLIWKYRGGPYPRKILGNERLISTWPVRGGPVLGNGTVYFTAGVWPFMGIFVHAIDAAGGKPVWINSGEGDLYTVNPHETPAFSNFVPRGHLAISDAGLVAPGGRTLPATYDLESGKLIAFEWAKYVGGAKHGPLPITAGSRTFSPGDGEVTSNGWKGAVEGTVWNMLAADNKLFVVTVEGSIYCFGAGDSKAKIIDETKAAQAKYQGPWTVKVAILLDRLKKTDGYCLVLGVGSGGLAEELARSSRLQVIVIDPDEKKVDAFRRRMTDAGLYGTRISAYVGNMVDYPLPPCLADLVVSEDQQSDDVLSDTPLHRAILRVLRPYGGLACFPVDGGWSTLKKPGPLPGAADWTHNYADAGNSVVSRDTRVRTPMGLLWFGNGPPNDEVLPRHGQGPSPQVAAGRLFIEGGNMIRGLDIYTGRLLWQRDLPGLGEFYDRTEHQPGAGEIGSNYVSLADSVYVVHGDKILNLGAASGRTIIEFTIPPGDDGSSPNWGGLAVLDDVLVATRVPTTADGKPTRFSSASRGLVAMNRHSGKILWQRQSTYGFRHNNIALGAGKVFCIDGLSKAKLEAANRRGLDTKNYKPRLMALELNTGKEIWAATEHVFGTFLNYSAEHGVLLQAGSAYRDRAPDESKTGMVAYRAEDGSVLWENLGLSHAGPCMLHGDMIIAQGPAYSLLTGKPKTRPHPLSGEPVKWDFKRNYGCNTAVAGQNLITFRSGAAGFFDIENDGGTGNFGGFKSSCTSNLIVAGGLLNAPEYTRTCSCSYQNQTSLAMVHDPKVETWTFNSLPWDGKPVRRVGINFGAPGDRRVGSGTLWLDYPSIGGTSPDLPIELKPKQPPSFRVHSALIESKGDAISWVAASGISGVQQISLTLAKDRQPRKYSIRLHFADTRPTGSGRRCFDVSLQGKTVLEGFDIIEQAGGAGQAIVKQFDGVVVAGKLEITLRATGELPSIICGIEAVADGW